MIFIGNISLVIGGEYQGGSFITPEAFIAPDGESYVL